MERMQCGWIDLGNSMSPTQYILFLLKASDIGLHIDQKPLKYYQSADSNLMIWSPHIACFITAVAHTASIRNGVNQ
jgi:hypothetical protein